MWTRGVTVQGQITDIGGKVRTRGGANNRPIVVSVYCF